MLRHKGNRRTYSHNLKLAAILSSVAGMVNVSGVLSLHTLTTNVTGHFAFFAEQLALKHYSTAFTFLTYIFFFLCGAFFCGLMVESSKQSHSNRSYKIPLLIEAMILLILAIYAFIDQKFNTRYPVCTASVLLFTMGLQNALASDVSQFAVRTTHLTGLFTDLGIELAQMIHSYPDQDKAKLKNSILLKLIIVISFFTGGIVGGIGYQMVHLRVLFLPGIMVIMALSYDHLALRYHLLEKKFSHH